MADEFLQTQIGSFSTLDLYKYIEVFLNQEQSVEKESRNSFYDIDNRQLQCYLNELIKKAETDSTSKSLLGTVYREGILADQNLVKARELYISAAMDNYAPAQYMLSSMYYKGDGGEPSFEQAYEWEKKAVASGHSWAADGLGFLYRAGLGCKRDLKEALACYTKVFEQGCGNSMSAIGEIYSILDDYDNAVKRKDRTKL